MIKHYFAIDGNYGDADGIVLVDTSLFTDEDWTNISEELDYARTDLAKNIYEHRLKEAGLE
jgi:hypothetical protein